MLFCAFNLIRVIQNLLKQSLPHAVAVVVFLLVTVFFFNPVFFKHKELNQHDINEYLGTSKSLRDHRDATGEEGLWASHVFSGMPAYLISVDWSDEPIAWMKRVGSLFLPHPVANIFWAFLSFYVLLIVFGVRPMLAIPGALAFGLSSFMIIGLGAGHNGRIGAIAFMPLVLAGVHLLFSGKKWWPGAALLSAAMALHLRENHLQMTYYLLLMVVAYGAVQLIEAIRNKTLIPFVRTLGIAVLVVVVAAGTFFGQFWSVTEYSKYSIRGRSELAAASSDADGLSRSYAFEYSNGIIEPLTLLIPNILGGSTMEAFVSDENSASYKALASASDPQQANELVRYTIGYWGEQSNTAPYYAGAVMVFLFILGLLSADRRWVWWLAPVSVLAIVLSWGDNFSGFNYFIFDHLPGYNKFRSVTFTLIMILIAIPLLGMLGLERWMSDPAAARKKVITAAGITGGLCLLLWLTGGLGDFTSSRDEGLPAWLLNALKQDRSDALASDALRSFGFIAVIALALLLDVPKRIGSNAFHALLILVVLADLITFDRRYFKDDNYRRVTDAAVELTDADRAISADTSYYRVYNIVSPMNEARTSYFHRSLGGYHGAKLRRYQDLYDAVIAPQSTQLITDAQSGGLDFSRYTSLNMLNARYLVYGPGADNVIPNPSALGPAWFVDEVRTVDSPSAELAALDSLDVSRTAVVDAQKFPAVKPWRRSAPDSVSSVSVREIAPNRLSYSVESTQGGYVVFSEIYYPEGWTAEIDGAPAEILRADYVLRALNVPAGRHTITFTFMPDAYRIGDKVTMASSWLVLLFGLAGLVLGLRQTNAPMTTGKK